MKKIIQQLISILFLLATEMNGSTTVIPVLSASPESGFQVGVVAAKYYRTEGSTPNSRPSGISPMFTYSTKGQVYAGVSWERYWAEETHYFKQELEYADTPKNFYGTGNFTSLSNEESISSRYALFKFQYLYRFKRYLRLGTKFDFKKETITKTESDGQFESSNYLGSSPYQVFGMGPIINIDSRDHILKPIKGINHTYSLLFYDTQFSDFQFTNFTVDLRQYIPISKNKTIALNALSTTMGGAVPVQFLAQLGGSKVVRGTYEGRYRDLNLMAFQAEYRHYQAFKKMGYVLFLGVGSVYSDFGHLDVNDFRIMPGFGLRFPIANEGAHLRFDFGFSEKTNFYVSYAEAW